MYGSVQSAFDIIVRNYLNLYTSTKRWLLLVVEGELYLP